MTARRWTGAGLVAITTAAAVALSLGFAGVAGSTPSNNTLNVALEDFPGPTEVTYGRNVASTLTVENPNTGSNNPWNTVVVTFPVPTNTNKPTAATATLMNDPCPDFPGTHEPGQTADVVCSLGTMAPGQKHTFLIVWQTWDSGTSADCSSSPCFRTTASVTGSDSTSSSKPKSPRSTFTSSVETPLLDTPGVDKNKAGTYALAGCGDPSSPTLTTNLALDKTNNPLSTSVCAPKADVPVLITESATVLPFAKTQVSTVCIPKAPSKCPTGTGTYVAESFDTYATFTLVVHNQSFTGQITKVFYDPDAPDLAFCELPLDAPSGDQCGGAYATITVNSSAKTTTIVVYSKHNGRFTGG